MSLFIEKGTRMKDSHVKGRKKKEGPQINKYNTEFIEEIKKYGSNYEKHYEDVDIIEWPGHTRYTDFFCSNTLPPSFEILFYPSNFFKNKTIF